MTFQLRKNRIIRRGLAAVLCLLLACTAALPAAAQEELSLASEAAVLMDAETGQILYEKNCRRQMYPASITKVMTGLLALTHLEPQQLLTVSQSAVDAVPRTSSHISLMPGEVLTLDQAMHALGMESANDAANVLGEAVSGSLEAFGQLMTRTAQELGAENTHFTNANGLPDSEHYTTAYDMALITAAALKVPGFTDYFSTVHYTFAATNLSSTRSFSNKNRILPGGQYEYEGVLMSKTGWTSSAEGTLVTAVRRGETTLVAVVLKSSLLEDKYRDTRKLFDYAFSGYVRTGIPGESIAQQLPMGDYLPIPGQKTDFLLPAGTDLGRVTFTLAEGMDLINATSDLTAVIVNAELDGVSLPTTDLIMVRQGVDPQAAAEAMGLVLETVPEDTSEPEAAPSPELLSARQQLLLSGAVLLPLAAFLLLRRRSQQKRSRRKTLEARIRQMKKQME